MDELKIEDDLPHLIATIVLPVNLKLSVNLWLTELQDTYQNGKGSKTDLLVKAFSDNTGTQSKESCIVQ